MVVLGAKGSLLAKASASVLMFKWACNKFGFPLHKAAAGDCKGTEGAWSDTGRSTDEISAFIREMMNHCTSQSGM